MEFEGNPTQASGFRLLRTQTHPLIWGEQSENVEVYLFIYFVSGVGEGGMYMGARNEWWILSLIAYLCLYLPSAL